MSTPDTHVPTPKTMPPKAKTFLVMNNGEYSLPEPHNPGVLFRAGQQTEVHEVTPWVQSQIDCGLFSLV